MFTESNKAELAKKQAELIAAIAAAKSIKAKCLCDVAIENAMTPVPAMKRTFKPRGNNL